MIIWGGWLCWCVIKFNKQTFTLQSTKCLSRGLPSSFSLNSPSCFTFSSWIISFCLSFCSFFSLSVSNLCHGWPPVGIRGSILCSYFLLSRRIDEGNLKYFPSSLNDKCQCTLIIHYMSKFKEFSFRSCYHIMFAGH